MFHKLQFHPFTSSPSTMRDIQLKLLIPESHPVLKTSRDGDTSLNNFLQVITTSFTTCPNFLFTYTEMKNIRSFGSNQQRAQTYTYTIQSIILKLLVRFWDIHHQGHLLFIQLWKDISPQLQLRSSEAFFLHPIWPKSNGNPGWAFWLWEPCQWTSLDASNNPIYVTTQLSSALRQLARKRMGSLELQEV